MDRLASGWSAALRDTLRHAWAPQTIRGLELAAADFLVFAHDRGVVNVSAAQPAPVQLVAEFLNLRARWKLDGSVRERPESLIKQLCSAIDLLHDRQPSSPIHHPTIELMRKAVVRVHTQRPIEHRLMAPIRAMLEYWRQQPNSELSECDLRRKAVGYAMIVKMARPSDLARLRLCDDDFSLDERGRLLSASPLYLSTKTDTWRRGSGGVCIRADSDDPDNDWVHVAYAYHCLTRRDRQQYRSGPFVLSLATTGKPYRRPVTADTISHIFRQFAQAAGLAGSDTLPSGCRPAAATAALAAGFPPHIVARLTGHKDLRTLQEHYNRTQVPAALSQALVAPDASTSTSISSSESSYSSTFTASSDPSTSSASTSTSSSSLALSGRLHRLLAARK